MTAIAARMTERASAWLDSLDTEQRGIAAWTFPSDEERTQWFYTPTDHGGLTIGAMSREQEQLALQLLRTGLSRAGYVTTVAIMNLENVLADLENWPSGGFRDPGRYYVRVFGEPGSDAWGWRIGGHHVSLHYAVVEGEVRAVTPSFFGADPAESPLLGPHLHRPLAALEDLARELVRSLDDEQAGMAIVSPVPPLDIVSGNRPVLTDGDEPRTLAEVFRQPVDKPFRDVLDAVQRSGEESLGLTRAHLERVRYGTGGVGLVADQMSSEQQDVFRALLEAYVSRFPDDIATRESEKFAAIEALSFGWAGATEPRRPHYYRIQGPRLVVEYDNVQRDANHIHTVWRDPLGDFGRDVLAEHHVAAHGD
jgi:hypothetical protein